MTLLVSRKTAGWKKGSLHHMLMLIPYSKYIPSPYAVYAYKQNEIKLRTIKKPTGFLKQLSSDDELVVFELS